MVGIVQCVSYCTGRMKNAELYYLELIGDAQIMETIKDLPLVPTSDIPGL